MKIKVLKRRSKQISEFSKTEWTQVDKVKYDHSTDWIRRHFFALAVDEKKNILGLCEFHYMGGVIEVIALIIKDSERGKGIGSELLEKMEQVARKENAHKVYLSTGKSWKANEFYLQHGYKKIGELTDHWQHGDFIEYEKYL